MNSAKCSENNPERGQASSVLFHNCRSFLLDELMILQPQILVTQGDAARQAVQQLCRPRPRDTGKCGTWIVSGLRPAGDTLWIPTFHPRAFGLFSSHKRECWDHLAAVAAAFVASDGTVGV